MTEKEVTCAECKFNCKMKTPCALFKKAEDIICPKCHKKLIYCGRCKGYHHEGTERTDHACKQAYRVDGEAVPMER